MKDQLIKAINTFSNLYPDYQINYIYIWDVDNNIVRFKIKGIKGDKEVIDMIKIDL